VTPADDARVAACGRDEKSKIRKVEKSKPGPSGICTEPNILWQREEIGRLGDITHGLIGPKPPTAACSVRLV
jgi:hypothetical protein